MSLGSQVYEAIIMSEYERLDRIEETLEKIAESQARFEANQAKSEENQARFEANQAKFEENQARFEANQAKRQKEIEIILSIQRELQEKQLNLTDAVARLIEAGNRTDQRINQLLGYSLSNESDHLDLTQRLINLEKRVNKLEGN